MTPLTKMSGRLNGVKCLLIQKGIQSLNYGVLWDKSWILCTQGICWLSIGQYCRSPLSVLQRKIYKGKTKTYYYKNAKINHDPKIYAKC